MPFLLLVRTFDQLPLGDSGDERSYPRSRHGVIGEILGPVVEEKLR
jgi:hypothetical protein